MEKQNLCYIEPQIKANLFKVQQINGHEKLIFGSDKKSGLKIVLAIHNTTLGPSTGGTRMAFVSEETAVEEALRLSYAMTFKCAIIDEPFGGTFLTGVDMGLSLEDAKIIGERTKYIFNSKGCSGITTAHGVFKGIKKTILYKLGRNNLRGTSIAVQGLGNVGGTLVDLLLAEKAKVFVSDIDPSKTEKYSKVTTIVPNDKIHTVECDVFAHCAVR